MNVSHLLSSIINGKWLMLPQTAFANHHIVDRLLSRDYTDEQFNKILSQTTEMSVLLEDRKAAAQSSQYDSLQSGTTAIFSITGTMLKYGTMCSYGTTEIAEAIKEAAAHKKIGSIILDIDSGGGAVDAIAPLLDAISFAHEKNKAVVALVDLCASAAYYVASHCDEIIASNDISSEIGSIGVMMSFPDYAAHYEKEGIKVHTIYSKLSDHKNLPFIQALEGKYELIKETELDPLARKFQHDVAESRGSKLKKETIGILSGAMFFARQAIEVGLIDSIGDMKTAIQRAKTLSNKIEINKYLNN